jgi:tetratricopeptide (TPR) repeat protein
LNIFAQTNQLPNSEIDSLQAIANNFLKTNDSFNTVRTYYQMAKIYDRIGELKKSNELLKKSLQDAQKLPDNKLVGQISNYLASNYSIEGKRKEALELYENAFKEFSEIKDTMRMSAVLMNIGTEYVSLSDYKKAIEYELKALTLKEESKDSSNIAYFHISLAELFFKIRNFDKWEEFLFIANKLSVNEEYASFSTRAKTLNELGEYYRRKNNINKSIETYKTLYNISTKNNYTNGISIALVNLVPIYIRVGDFINAEKAAFKSLELDRKGENVSGVIYNLVQLGMLNRTLNRNSSAKKYLIEGLELSKKYNSKENEVRAYEELYLVNKNLADYKEALFYFEKYSSERDSLLDQETKRNINEIETKYESEKKEARINFLKKENDLQIKELAQQQILIFAVIITSLLFLILGFIYYKNTKIKAELKTVIMEHKMLRSQMNPHFIFNSLMAIQNYMLKNDAEKSADYLAEFASLIRLILTSSRSDKISLNDEIKITNYYLSLQKMRFKNKFEYSIFVGDNIDRESYSIPPMLIQPFVENAVEHGLRLFKNNDGRIIVNFMIEDSELIITIEDNGPGISTDEIKNDNDHISYATQITNERIMTIDNMKGGKITLLINNIIEDGITKGTLVKFLIPKSIYNSK